MLLLVGSRMDRADIKNLFAMGVVKSLVGECKAAKENEQNSAPNRWLHMGSAGAMPSSSALESG